jgi:uncharacterized protein with von Willebrand factor type A (vWA) domain
MQDIEHLGRHLNLELRYNSINFEQISEKLKYSAAGDTDISIIQAMDFLRS